MKATNSSERLQAIHNVTQHREKNHLVLKPRPNMRQIDKLGLKVSELIFQDIMARYYDIIT